MTFINGSPAVSFKVPFLSFGDPVTLLYRVSAIAIVATITAGAAHATLGAAYESVELDRARLGARHVMASQARYAVHLLTTPGGLLREFTRPDGAVFAVTWRGAGRPNLRQALGPYFDVLNAANPPHRRGGRHIPLTASQSDLVVRSGGHSGAFYGVAYVPALVPVGVTPASLP